MSMKMESIMRPQDNRRGHVLIVDDDPIQRLLLHRSVELVGWSSDAAACLADAVRCLELHRYDAVILDLSLGEKEGVSLLRHFKSGPTCPFVIFLSGMDSRVKAASARIAGALGVRVAGTLSKPFAPAALREMLESSPLHEAGANAGGTSVTAEVLELALANDQIVVE